MSATSEDIVAGFVARPRKYLRLTWQAATSVLEINMHIRPVQCYSLAGMAELQSVLAFIDQHPGLVRVLAFASDVPGVFNFGGDLALFVLLARAKDVQSLRMYGQRCLDLVWWLETAASRDVYTVAVIQGDALGGGLESALPFHRLIAERSASAGFPEVLFNLFPGMGAWNFASRRAGVKVAQEMVTTGKVYSGAQLVETGIVDQLAEDGQGRAAMQEAVQATLPRLRGQVEAMKARALALPIARASLDAIVNAWADAALKLTDRDLRLMERLARAQLKKVGGALNGAIEEIKMMELEEALASERRQTEAVACPA